MKVRAQLDNAKREMFTQAAMTETGESRVDPQVVKEAVEAVIAEGDFSLHTFQSGTVGVRLRIKVAVSNEAGEEFDLTGSILLTIPETR
jgi:hypothetical protein